MYTSKSKISVGLLLGLLALPAAARADSAAVEPSGDDTACVQDALCLEYYRSGRTYSKAGQMDRALYAYIDAYLRQPLPRLMFNIGRAHHRLKHPLQAAAAYQRFLNEKNAAIDPSLRERAREHLSDALLELPPNLTIPSELLSGRAAITYLDPRRPPETPLYKKWWLWTAVGAGVAALAIGVGVGVGVGLR